jgi:hypothetical protein
MWINKVLFQTILDDNKRSAGQLSAVGVSLGEQRGKVDVLSVQKAKDDLTIDWMRHRINALEKERAILLQKVAGVSLPVPEIVPTRPGTMSTPPDFVSLPSFEDVGDEEAARLGIKHEPDGSVTYTK